jgi:hypothetical protein
MARRLVFGAFAPVAGVLIDGHGLGWGLWTCGAVGLVGATLLYVKEARRRRRGLASFEGEVTPTPVPDAAPVALAEPPREHTIH